MPTESMSNTVNEIPGRSVWSQRELWIAVSLYYLFLFYGSLVPFNFISLEGSLAHQFSDLIRSDWGYVSRSDLVVNIILGVPAGFLVLGTLCGVRSILWRLLFFVPTLAVCVMGAVAVEAFQMYLPGRNAAMMDVGAQLFGAIFGAGLYLCLGPGLLRWSYSLYEKLGEKDGLIYWLGLYLFLLMCSALAPLDVVTSPQELYHKWKSGAIVLIPFAQLFVPIVGDSAMAGGKSGGWDWVALGETLELGFRFLPLGILIAWLSERDRQQKRQDGDFQRSWASFCFGGFIAALFWSVCFGLIVTFIHTLIASRDVYSSDIIVAVVFSCLGYAAFCISRTLIRVRAFSLLAMAVWLLALGIAYWNPFAFQFQQIDWGPLYSRDNLIPLADYQLSNPFSATERLFSRCGNSLILSFLVCLSFYCPSRPFRSFAPICVCFVCFAFLEAGQLFIPGRTFTLSDIIVQTVIAGIGCRLFHSILNIPRYSNKTP